MVSFSSEEIEAYRAKREAEAAEVQKTQAKLDKDAHDKKRQELESTLKQRFLAAGGREAEWIRHKDRVVADALIAATLEPVKEEPPKVIPAPLPRSRYKN